jgi:hypothetical protein
VQAEPVNRVVVEGDYFATIDDVNPFAATLSNQETPLGVPSGWALAPADDLSRQAASSSSWGTECLVLADGTLTPTSAGARCDVGIVIQATSLRPPFRRVFIKKSGKDFGIECVVLC